MFTRDESPLLDKKGRRLYYKDGHRVMGKPLYNSSGKAIVDKSRNPLYGKPVYGVPQEHPSIDKDDNILYLRPTKGQPVSKRNGQQLYDILGKPLQHKNGIPFFDKHGDHLHGQPVFDKDRIPIYNNDCKCVSDNEGQQFYYFDGEPVLKSGKPLYHKAAFDKNNKILSDKNGHTLYGKDVKPLYWEDVYDKYGKPYYGELYDVDGNLCPTDTCLEVSC